MPRALFAWLDDGLWWPDEYYQALEPAHRAVFGYGWQAWEFLEGARHWTLPGLIAAVIWSAERVGLDYRLAVTALCVGVNAATVVGVSVLARRAGASERAAITMGVVAATAGLFIYASPRALGENLSALPVVLGLACLVRPTPRLIWLGGALLCLAVGFRLQNAVLCLGALGLVRERKNLARLVGAFAVGAVLYGFIDWVTWGQVFHSARVYLSFNLIEGRASAFGTQPWFHFLTTLVTAEGVTVLPAVVLSGVAFRSSPKLPVLMLVFLLVHSLIPHKELRFIFPVLPVLCAHAALGLDRFPRHVGWALVALGCVSGATLPWLTYGRLGITDPPRATSAIDLGGPENRLLKLAGQQSDVCGVRVDSIVHWRTAGYFALHRAVPIVGPEKPQGQFNYVIGKEPPPGGERVTEDHGVALYRLPGACVAAPPESWNLE